MDKRIIEAAIKYMRDDHCDSTYDAFMIGAKFALELIIERMSVLEHAFLEPTGPHSWNHICYNVFADEIRGMLGQ